MLRIILASTLIVGFAQAGILTGNNRGKRSPQGQFANENGAGNPQLQKSNGNPMTQRYVNWSDRSSDKIADGTGNTFKTKAVEGVGIENEGVKVQNQGKINFKTVEHQNTASVDKALDDVDKGQDQVAGMMNGGNVDGRGNNNNNGGRN